MSRAREIERWRRLAKLYEREERQAAHAYALGKQQILQQQQRARQMNSFRREYLASTQEQAKSGVSATVFQQLSAFLVQVEQAEQSAEEQSRRLRLELDRLEANWQEKRRRWKAIEYLLEKKQSEMTRHRAKRNQRWLDEFVLNS